MKVLVPATRFSSVRWLLEKGMGNPGMDDLHSAAFGIGRKSAA